MHALQSFSLPRSGPRVTASACPPVVLRQRRRDFEALFRSEIRDGAGSWPNRTARCSPGLPHLEPHPRPRENGSTDGRVRARGPTAARRPWPSPRHGGGRSGRHPCRAPTLWNGTVCSVTEVTSSPVQTPGDDGRRPQPTPRRPARSPDTRQPDPPEGGPAAAASEVSRIPCAAWCGPPKRSARSARPRSVRSAAAVEGVHVADGLIRSRSVARGREIGAMTPAPAWGREVPPSPSTQGPSGR